MKHLSISIAIMFLIAFLGSAVYSGDFSLVNKSGTTVTNIYVLGSGSTSWNRLPVANSMSNGDKVTFDFQPASDNCVFTLKFVDSNGNEHLMDNVNICETSEIILAVNDAQSVPKIDLKAPGRK